MLKKVLGVVGVVVFLGLAFVLLRSETSEGPGSESPGQGEASKGLDQGASRRRAETDLDSTRERVPLPTSPDDEALRVPLPPLDESDPFVRTRLESFDLPADWVAQENLVRRLAAVVDGATRGEIPRSQVRFLKPEGRFAVYEREGGVYADPRNARRFDPFLDLLEGIDPTALAGLLVSTGPLLDQALAELGGTGRGREELVVVIDRILEMPRPSGSPELVQRKVLYEYVDEDLEALPPLEKQLLRLGPKNLDRLQRYLTALRAELVVNRG